MGIKDKMMDSMMNKMSPKEKKEMMEKMMENFFSDISEEEKKEIMREMMQNMMKGGNLSMMDMMGMMMGGEGDGGFNPGDMCKQMMSSFTQTSKTTSFATSEMQELFEEWVNQLNEEILNLIKKKDSIGIEEIANELKISKNSVIYFISKLAQQEKIKLKIAGVVK